MREYFQWELMRDVLFCPVTAMSEMEQADGTAIFTPGYNKEVRSDSGNLTIDKISDQDSTWKVAGRSNKTEFESKVRMTGRDKNGLCEWSATSSGKYDEENGYTATVDFEIPATFYWKTTTSSYYIAYNLYCNGKYLLKSYKNGTFIESIEKTFTEQSVY